MEVRLSIAKSVRMFRVRSCHEFNNTASVADLTETGAGQGNMNALASGGAEQNARHSKTAVQQR